MANPSRSAFFYGTLMAPKVLHRVCHGSDDPNNPIFTMHQFKTYQAILHHHRRHRVEGLDYPAVVPHTDSTVRGTYVTGLTDNDIERLDIFEGDQYARQKVKVRILDKIGNDTGAGNVEGDEVEAETYIWIAGADDLEEKEWDFAEFQREKLRFWVGSESTEYTEVDEAVAAKNQNDGTGGRGANGHLSHALLEAQKKDGSRLKTH